MINPSYDKKEETNPLLMKRTYSFLKAFSTSLLVTKLLIQGKKILIDA